MLHELAHAGVMRVVGVEVAEIRFAFGSPVWETALPNGVMLRLGWIPLGGWAASVPEGPRSLPEASAAARLFVGSAGVAANVLIVILLLVILIRLAPSGTFPLAPNGRSAEFGRSLVGAARIAFQTLAWPVVFVRALLQEALGRPSTFKTMSEEIPRWKEMNRRFFFLRSFVLMNATLAEFNVFPILGLDGYKMCHAAAGLVGGSLGENVFQAAASGVVPTIFFLIGVGLIRRYFRKNTST